MSTGKEDVVFPMFPKDELIHVSENVFIHDNPRTQQFKVWLNVGVQYFEIDTPHDELESAEWSAEALNKAIQKLKDK